MSKERRKFTRVSFDSQSHVLCDGKTHEAHLLDISLKGALVQMEDTSFYEPQKECALKITLSGSTIVLEVNVQMVHQREDRIGLHFITIDVDSLTHLRKLIELNMGDADKALKELFLWTTP